MRVSGREADERTEIERIEREEFARGHIGPGEDPVEPRPAATLVLVRDAPEARGLQVLLLRRPDTARFAAGAYVFPGGVIDPEDDDPALADRFGPAVAGEERHALVAALRELFEETGLLPGERVPRTPELAEARRRLLAGEVDFPGLIREWDVSFRGLRVSYLSRWVTPPRLSRRYDARFFLAEHRGGEPELLGEEHTWALWIEPRAALRRFRLGELPMLFPTRKTVEEMAEWPDVDAALEVARSRRVRPIRPRLLVRDDRVIPLMPGDERAGADG